MEENKVVIRELRTLNFDFDWPNNINENLKHEIRFIIKSNESLAEKTENKIEQLLSKFKL